MVSQETALAHRVTLANVHLAYAPASCSPTQETESFVVFHFPLTRCGTTVQVGAGAVGRCPALLPRGGPQPAVSSPRWLVISSSMRTSWHLSSMSKGDPRVPSHGTAPSGEGEPSSERLGYGLGSEGGWVSLEQVIEPLGLMVKFY